MNKSVVLKICLSLFCISISFMQMQKAVGQDNHQITRYARFLYNNEIKYGIVDEESVYLIKGDLFGTWTKTDEVVSLNEVRLLAPCEPSKVIAMAYNFASHTVNRPKPEKPIAFAKLPTCIVGHGDNIEMPGKSTNLHYEGELVVVFSKKTQNISKEEVTDHILGVTIGNDVSERNWQREDPRWLLAKATDTFGPLGPWIVHGLKYDDLLIETRLNGETVQSQRTSDMFFSLEECVSYLSYYITFYPGDVLFLGTPGTTKKMEAGDTVEVEIEHIGILKNKVVRVD